MKKIMLSLSFILFLFTSTVSAQWTVSGNNTYFNKTGNVGIGTSNPMRKLDVVGNASISGSLDVSNVYSTGSLSAERNLFIEGNSEFLGSSTFLSQTTFNSSVGIGTESNINAKLDVAGTIRAHEVKVCLNQGCDFVFEPDYNLMPLEELDHFVTTKKHLPLVAPAALMEDEGINLSEMNALLLQKVEELTLYIIAQDKRINEQSKRLEALEYANSIINY